LHREYVQKNAIMLDTMRSQCCCDLIVDPACDLIVDPVAMLLRLCYWPIREESIIYYTQRLVYRRVATTLRSRCRSSI